MEGDDWPQCLPKLSQEASRTPQRALDCPRLRGRSASPAARAPPYTIAPHAPAPTYTMDARDLADIELHMRRLVANATFVQRATARGVDRALRQSFDGPSDAALGVPLRSSSVLHRTLPDSDKQLREIKTTTQRRVSKALARIVRAPPWPPTA